MLGCFITIYNFQMFYNYPYMEHRNTILSILLAYYSLIIHVKRFFILSNELPES